MRRKMWKTIKNDYNVDGDIDNDENEENENLLVNVCRQALTKISMPSNDCQ